jgi:hypothetical protein
MLQDCREFPVVLAEESLAARALPDTTLNSVPLRVQPVLITNMFDVPRPRHPEFAPSSGAGRREAWPDEHTVAEP